MKPTNYQLSKLLDAKVTDSAVYFLGGPFSNFFEARVEYDNKSFMTSEHAYMYAKAKYFRDTSAAQYIHLKATSPAEAKKVGRQVKNFDPNEWFNVSYNIMLEINREKYKDANLRQSLLLTGNRELVECNGKDQIWGIGLYNSSELIYDKSNWKGLNLLGRVLMEVRNELREEVYQENYR